MKTATLRVVESQKARDLFRMHANNSRLPANARRLAATLATLAGNEARLWLSALRS